MIIWVQVAELVLKNWKESPHMSKKEMRIFASWTKDKMHNQPLSEPELNFFKDILKTASPRRYQRIFPGEFAKPKVVLNTAIH